MKKRLLSFSFIVFACGFAFAQSPEIKRANHWYFGWNAGLNFSNGAIVPDTNGAYNNYEAAATISDTAGNLLFYTDAETVWNRTHQIMQNGTNIGGCWSSTQGALIVPKPGNDSIYYIFTTDCAENNLVKGLRYSIVNMHSDSGRGAVTQKNILLHTPVAEKLAGIHHANGTDVWVVPHEWNSNKFLAYLVTNNGIDTVPVESSIGSFHGGFIQSPYTPAGYVKFSPNGKKLVSMKVGGNHEIELFDFNDSTGSISNSITLASGGSLYPYGASFSPDNSKLYVSYGFGGGDGNPLLPGKIYQYNLFAGIPSNIINSKTLIFAPSNNFSLALQNAPDRKIYISITNNLTNEGAYLGVINTPNALGTNCNFVSNGINLFANGKMCRYGLPNYIESYFNCDTCKVDSLGVGVSEQLSNSYNLFIFPNPLIDELYIQSSDEILSLTIKNIQGISFYKTELLYPEKNFRIQVSSFPDGLYMIYLTTKNNTYIRKLIKIKN